MNLQTLSGCCSSAHLYGVTFKDIMGYNKDNFRYWVRKQANVSSVIYITNFDLAQRRALRKNLGFKTVNSYKDGNVHTMILNF